MSEFDQATDELFEAACEVAEESGFPVMPERLERRLRIGRHQAERLAAQINATEGADA